MNVERYRLRRLHRLDCLLTASARERVCGLLAVALRATAPSSAYVSSLRPSLMDPEPELQGVRPAHSAHSARPSLMDPDPEPNRSSWMAAEDSDQL